MTTNTSERPWKRWLLASLVLNLFLVGGIAGAAWQWWKLSAHQPRNLRFAADELQPEQKLDYRLALRDARRKAAGAIQTAREGRQEVLRLLAAPQLDRAAAAAALARTREADIAARAGYEAAVLDFAATLSPQDRQKLASGLARRSGLGQAGPPPQSPKND